DTLMQRIALRDRPYERQMERSYINDLNIAYEEFFSKPFDHTPVLVVDSNNLNVIQNVEDLKLIENRIRQSLSLPPFQQALPLT
ncbi:MAG TPA: deoxynucleoside kinase, partial [Anaerolineales bacterium]|nr:deoxynucleoside kinase [Anaerolineales bacterium]